MKRIESEWVVWLRSCLVDIIMILGREGREHEERRKVASYLDTESLKLESTESMLEEYFIFSRSFGPKLFN